MFQANSVLNPNSVFLYNLKNTHYTVSLGKVRRTIIFHFLSFQYGLMCLNLNYKTDVTAYSGLIQVDFVIKLCMILWSTICKMKHSQQLYCYISVWGGSNTLGHVFMVEKLRVGIQ